MKTPAQNHPPYPDRSRLAPAWRRCLFGALVAIAMAVTFAAQATTLYDNSSTRSVPARFAHSTFEFGDEIILAGPASGTWTITNFQYEYFGFGTDFAMGNATVALRFYRNDGADGRPGTLLFDSGFSTISATPDEGFVLDYKVCVSVPKNFTWAVLFMGAPAMIGQSSGLDLYDPPTVGSTFDDYWERSGGGGTTWVLRGPLPGQPPISFGARAQGLLPGAVPADAGLWLRADAGIGGSPVSLWLDQSGNARNATQGAPGSQPTLVPAVINGLPVVRLDGVDDFLTFPMGINGLSGMTIFLVGNNAFPQTSGMSHAEKAALFWNETAFWSTTYLSPFQTEVSFRFGTTQVGNFPLHPRASVGTAFTVNTAIKDGSTDSLYINGALALSEGGKFPTLAQNTAIGNVGRGFNDNTFFAGDIAEIIVFERALCPAERQSVEAYLTTKYFGGPPPCVAPAIVTAPANMTVTEPNTATFSVTASGTGPLSYQWFRGVMPVGGNSPSYTTPPTTVGADNGATFSVKVSNACGMATSGSATLTVNPPGGRVTSGILVLYKFTTGAGTTVFDVGGFGAPLNLTILDPAKILWLGGMNGVNFIAGGSAISSVGAATKVNTAIAASGRLTMEAWVAPSSTTQFGPARIATLSEGINTTQVNAHLGQGAGTFSTGTSGSARLRNTANTFNWLQVPSIFTSSALVHVAMTYDGTTLRFYKDGVQQGGGLVMPGGLGNWNTLYKLLLGNEDSLDRSWLGIMRCMAIYDRALSLAEIQTNFAAGPSGAPGPCVAPAIVTAPANMTVTEPNTATFSVSASGTGPLSYQWFRGVMPVGANSSSYTTPPTTVGADNGAMFSVEVMNACGMVTSAAATLTVNPPGSRVTTDLIALYLFNEMGGGPTIKDRSGFGAPLDLTILDPVKIVRLGGGMNGVHFMAGGSSIRSAGPATKVHTELVASDQFTLEAWVQPDSLTQFGPARIATVSDGFMTTQVNAHLGQGAGTFSTGMMGSGRVRTSANTFNWLQVPSVFTSTATLIHVVITYDGATLKLFKNGVQQGAGLSATGNLNNWDPSYPVILGNEFGHDRSWLGIMKLIAIYRRALTPGEIATNFGAGPSAPLAPFVEVVGTTLEVQADGDQVQLKLTGGAGESYIVEHSSNLLDWEPVTAVTLPDTNPAVWQDTITVDGPIGFFRALVD